MVVLVHAMVVVAGHVGAAIASHTENAPAEANIQTGTFLMEPEVQSYTTAKQMAAEGTNSFRYKQ